MKQKRYEMICQELKIHGIIEIDNDFGGDGIDLNLSDNGDGNNNSNEIDMHKNQTIQDSN